ncbi:hypothetical protein F5Y16DRAFT_422439 [Xylariaceae sp. FL0255]|nr:hypothetical protein F5Y16DRAFT_422439 [Xylariaceae sp. FL0255]
MSSMPNMFAKKSSTEKQKASRVLRGRHSRDQSVEVDWGMMTPPLTPTTLSSATFSTTSSVAPSDTDTVPPTPSVTIVNGMPYTHARLMEMGQALSEARLARTFPTTNTPTYNLHALIDDYEDLQRLNTARQSQSRTSTGGFCPDPEQLLVDIQRRITNRDLTHGETAADNNVRARLSGMANGANSEVGIYSLMRHAVNSMLRQHGLASGEENDRIDAAAARVIEEIRSSVQNNVARGEHGVGDVNMNGVMDEVFNVIQAALLDRENTQLNNMNNITDAHQAQIDSMASLADAHRVLADAQGAQLHAITGHVGSIDNHVHALGNNINAMGGLVNSTNSNVTAMGTQVTTLQTLINMLPQMVADDLRRQLPHIIGPAVQNAAQNAFESALTNELAARLRVVVNAMNNIQAGSKGHPKDGYEPTAKGIKPKAKKVSKKRSWFSKFNPFKKDRRDDRDRDFGGRHASGTSVY